MLDIKNYQEAAQRTSSTKCSVTKLLNGILGLNGEVGELTDLIKKHYFQDHDLDMEKIKEELGDILWYIAETATALNISLDDVTDYNIEKLKRRYPKGFDKNKSINR